MYTYETTSDAYLAALREVWRCPDFDVAPRGRETREKINYMFCVSRPTSRPIETASKDRNEVMARYTEAEMRLYATGERDAKVWSDLASKFWGGLANPDGTINSNYGWMINFRKIIPKTYEGALHYYMNHPRYETAWSWAIESLATDPNSRQAFVRFSTPDFQWYGNKDQPCTMHMHFMLRNAALHATTVMRSNDLVKGLAYDLPYFCMLLEKMAEDLREIGVLCSIGSYYHLSHSMHIYERDERLVLDMIGEES